MRPDDGSVVYVGGHADLEKLVDNAAVEAEHRSAHELLTLHDVFSGAKAVHESCRNHCLFLETATPHTVQEEANQVRALQWLNEANVQSKRADAALVDRELRDELFAISGRRARPLPAQLRTLLLRARPL